MLDFSTILSALPDFQSRLAFFSDLGFDIPSIVLGFLVGVCFALLLDVLSPVWYRFKKWCRILHLK